MQVFCRPGPRRRGRRGQPGDPGHGRRAHRLYEAAGDVPRHSGHHQQSSRPPAIPPSFIWPRAGVTRHSYEAASIDGANLPRHAPAPIPRILPSVAVMILLSISQLFLSNFDQVYNLYNNFGPQTPATCSPPTSTASAWAAAASSSCPPSQPAAQCHGPHRAGGFPAGSSKSSRRDGQISKGGNSMVKDASTSPSPERRCSRPSVSTSTMCL